MAEANLIEGMMLDEEMDLICDYIYEHITVDGSTLEIGAYLGKVSYLFCAIKELKFGIDKVSHFAVDIFDNGEQECMYHYSQHQPENYLMNLSRYNGKVTPFKGYTNEPERWDDVLRRKYDMVFIDADHKYPQVLQDLLLADLVTDNIFGHDYGHIGVTRSVDRFIAERGYTMKVWKLPYGLFDIQKYEKSTN